MTLREKLIAEFDLIYWRRGREGRLVEELADAALAILAKEKAK